jgi:hypothetical protein
MEPKLKTILNVIVVIAVVLWLLKAFGVLGSAAQRPGGFKLSWQAIGRSKPPAQSARLTRQESSLVPLLRLITDALGRILGDTGRRLGDPGLAA